MLINDLQYMRILSHQSLSKVWQALVNYSVGLSDGCVGWGVGGTSKHVSQARRLLKNRNFEGLFLCVSHINPSLILGL